MSTRLFLALAAVLLIVRLPSLVQPMGADQSLYAYVADRILEGGLPYRDAWDQKPPGIHFTYAAMRAIWGGPGVVAAADLAVAAGIAWLLFVLGRREGNTAVGAGAALLFLLLSNPAFTRVGGVRLRSQCETFIALAVAAAFVLIWRRGSSAGDVGGAASAQAAAPLTAGALLGIAFTFKYNAAIYAAGALAVLWLWRRLTLRDALLLAAGSAIPVAATLALFAGVGLLQPLYDATILYNVQYSGETYRGPLDLFRYLATFPIAQARIDALWTLGGAGCLILLAGALQDRARLVPVVWVGCACLSIAINGSRGLPQYFVQANPALALAAASGTAVAVAWGRRALAPGVRKGLAIAGVATVAVAVWRVNQFPKLVDQTMFDARYALGRTSRLEHLQRYDDDRKYSAFSAAQLGEFLRAHSGPADRVYVFGFTCGAYLEAGRVSASRFFWSRPVILEFNQARPGYGSRGLLGDLEQHPPAVIALQVRDWAPDVSDSAAFFTSTPELAGWLRAGYERAAGPDGFDVWLRRRATP